jgi:hypothetical protein
VDHDVELDLVDAASARVRALEHLVRRRVQHLLDVRRPVEELRELGQGQREVARVALRAPALEHARQRRVLAAEALQVRPVQRDRFRRHGGLEGGERLQRVPEPERGPQRRGIRPAPAAPVEEQVVELPRLQPIGLRLPLHVHEADISEQADQGGRRVLPHHRVPPGEVGDRASRGEAGGDDRPRGLRQEDDGPGEGRLEGEGRPVAAEVGEPREHVAARRCRRLECDFHAARERPHRRQHVVPVAQPVLEQVPPPEPVDAVEEPGDRFHAAPGLDQPAQLALGGTILGEEAERVGHRRLGGILEERLPGPVRPARRRRRAQGEEALGDHRKKPIGLSSASARGAGSHPRSTGTS